MIRASATGVGWDETSDLWWFNCGTAIVDCAEFGGIISIIGLEEVGAGVRSPIPDKLGAVAGGFEEDDIGNGMGVFR